MHDGRFADLDAVVAHYVSGVRRTANLDPNLGKHPDAGMEISASDRKALVAFLGTLTTTQD
jgi:cytochrome c peroxidase